MSVLTADVQPDVQVADSAQSSKRWQRIEHFAIAVLLAFWAIPMTHWSDTHRARTEMISVVLLAVILVAVRAWRAPIGSAAAAATVSAAALLVCVVAPTGWRGSDVAAGYVVCAAAFLVLRRYLRIEERRDLIAVAVCLAGIFEFVPAFAKWWSARNPSSMMLGSVGGHNQFAAFLFPGAVVGLGLFAQRRSPWHIVGLLSSAVCTAGIALSTSRATMAVLVAAWLAIGVAHVRDRRTLARIGAGIAISIAVTAILPGPPLFSHYSSPLSATAARASGGESLNRNGTFRSEAWRAAADVARHRPITGSGFHGLATAGAQYTPSGWIHGPIAFNGYLQALSDGGLLLGLPLLAGLALMAFWALRRYLGFLRARERSPGGSVTVAMAIAMLGAFAHSAVDYDWVFPALMLEVVLLAVCVAPGPRVGASRYGGLRLRSWVGAGSVVAAGAALVICVPALHQWQVDQPAADQSTATLLAHAQAPFGDDRPADAILRRIEAGDHTATPAQVQAALELTATESKIDSGLAALRRTVAARYGLLAR